MSKWLDLGKATFKDFGDDEGTRLAAALSYYTVFSLPPLIILLVSLLSAVLGPEDVQNLVTGQAGAMLGPAAGQLQDILQSAKQPGQGRGLASILGIVALVLGATGAFLQLQGALNRIWEVKPDPRQGGVKSMLVKRVFSFGMLLTLGFLMLVSLLVSTLLEAFGGALDRMLPDPFSGVFLQVLNLAVSLLVIAVLFGLMFRYMPDAEVSWKDVRAGAVFTAVLFMIGKFALSIYLGSSNPGSAFGAAGSLALLLVWIYYSAIIVFIGAEFTQAWARAHGRRIVPEQGAVRIVEETREVRPKTSPSKGPQGLKATSSPRVTGRPPLRGKSLLVRLGLGYLWSRLQGPQRPGPNRG